MATALGLATAGTSNAGGLLTTPTPYQGFFFGDFNGASDIQGRLAVGGNMSVSNYSVGNALSNSDNSLNGLTVGGNLSYLGGNVYHGNVAVGGNVTFNSGTTINNGSLYYGGTATGYNSSAIAPIHMTNGGIASNFFSTQEVYATKESTYLANTAANPTNGTSQLKYGTLTLSSNVRDANKVVYFSVTAAQLASASDTELKLSGPAAATSTTVVVNVIGSMTNSESWHGGLNLNGFSADHVVWNFSTATEINAAGIGILGSLLAPDATFNFASGQIDGQVVALNYGTSTTPSGGEFDPPIGFKGNLPTPAATPEPSTFVLAALGGLGLTWAALRRRAAKSPV